MEDLTKIWLGSGLAQISLGQILMLAISLALLYLAIGKRFEPLLLVPIGFGGLLSNIPGAGIATGDGILHLAYEVGIETGAFPLVCLLYTSDAADE